jgi:hypothetical protein
MLSISSVANSDGVPELGTAFLVASIEIVEDSCIRVWFTRPHTGGTTTSNYILTGPSVRNIVLAQQETDTRGVRIYTDAALEVGQWTLSFTSGIVSNDSDAVSLPTETEVVFDLVDLTSQDTVGTGLVEGVVSKFIPKSFRSKQVYSAIVEGFEAGDAAVAEQTRLAFDQSHVSTASGKYLVSRASDRGVSHPNKLGIQDADFRKLVTTVTNNKLTSDGILSVLELMYGEDSVHGYVESAVEGPFEVFDGAFLDGSIDGNQTFHFVASWVNYAAPLRATCTELRSALNFFFDKNSIKAYCSVVDNKLRIYSKTKGLQSSVTITGGTLQAFLQLDSSVFGSTTPYQQQSLTWSLTNPSPGIVRFTPENATTVDFANPALRPRDYVTIIGENFPLELRGSWPIVDVYYAYSGPAPIEWFDIEHDYITPPVS